jgi:hypothetical protein
LWHSLQPAACDLEWKWCKIGRDIDGSIHPWIVSLLHPRAQASTASFFFSSPVALMLDSARLHCIVPWSNSAGAKSAFDGRDWLA